MLDEERLRAELQRIYDMSRSASDVRVLAMGSVAIDALG